MFVVVPFILYRLPIAIAITLKFNVLKRQETCTFSYKLLSVRNLAATLPYLFWLGVSHEIQSARGQD
jgi:hypothetical protein